MKYYTLVKIEDDDDNSFNLFRRGTKVHLVSFKDGDIDWDSFKGYKIICTGESEG
jgi:hypothetical protein